jgi:hypothetical protein
MIKDEVIAAWGYGEAITKAKMDMPDAGNRVFVYVNGRGIIAAGEVIGDVSERGTNIFGEDPKGDEFHRKVKWLATVQPDQAIKIAEVSQMGYNMPVRCTIGRWNDSRVAERVEKKLIEKRNLCVS